jgi:3-isopropylmalate dehydrogenase
MNANNVFHIAVLPGDGIGIEVTSPCLDVLRAAAARVGSVAFHFEQHDAGAICYRETGVALPDKALAAARNADAVLLGAMGWPEVRYPDGTEISPQIDLRIELGLYAGVRPVRTLPNMKAVLSDEHAQNLDFVIIRESTEGLFASRGKGTSSHEQATDTMVITRAVCEPLFDFAFSLARSRRKYLRTSGSVTCVDKANVFKSFAFFRKIFDERALLNSDIHADRAYVDAVALNMVRKPWAFDVLVTENMFGDILSDLGAGLMGGMGFAPSADIGDHHAVFQPCHGTAPDIFGQGKANPTAMFLSAAMMLDWLAQKHRRDDARTAADIIRAAVDRVYMDGLKPYEARGDAGTKQITKAVLDAITQVEVAYL